MRQKNKFILWFKEIDIKDVPLVGGKNASLGEMYQKLTKQGVKVPNGFAITAWAYRYFLKKTKTDKQIKKILRGAKIAKVRELQRVAKAVREAILQAELPADLVKDIKLAYKKLSANYKSNNIDVAVRSSATAEDLPSASFAGQQETFLNIDSEAELLKAVKKCFASLFTDRAISYRTHHGFNHFKVALSVSVQKMVRADKAVSGVMFTLDTESGFKDMILINSAYGLGENIVKGLVNPDEYYVFKPTLQKHLKGNKKIQPIISQQIGSKEKRLIYSTGSDKGTKNVSVSPKDQRQLSLTQSEVIKLSQWGLLIEQHYKRPMDIEWAKDGLDNQLYIVQARPETIHSIKDPNVLEEYRLSKRSKVVCSGDSIGAKIGQGKAKVILDTKDIHKFKPGEVLVTDMTDPDWEPIMKIASAIVTDSGGRTCHSAIVSRELGIPCVVGTKTATQKIKTGQKITVSAAEGEEGFVYNGLLPFKVKKINLQKVSKPRTKIMLNIGNPKGALANTMIPSDGVGLAREEFIINTYIKIHPLALLNFAKLKDKKAKKKIEQLTSGYKNKSEFFVDKLAEGIAMIGSAFYPKEVIVRLSDFKSNEYANLIGGQEFEPTEGNPMIGWRGASRYYDSKYLPAFKLECQALKKVRREMGLDNVKIMVPFCRTVEEGKKVLKIMATNGLKSGKNNLEIYVMCEIPSNVISGAEFAKIFDGFSIGSNDLTQLALGVDRDSALVSHVYDERNQAVKDLISQIIQIAKKHKKKIGICGQAPSDFPDFAQFLVKEGIDSISLNPDTVVKTTIAIAKAEKQLKRRKKK